MLSRIESFLWYYTDDVINHGGFVMGNLNPLKLNKTYLDLYSLGKYLGHILNNLC